MVNTDERELFCINKALASVGLPSISMQDFIEGYYFHPYLQAGSRMLLRSALSAKKIAEKAIEAYNKEFSERSKLARLEKRTICTLEALKAKDIPLAIATLRRNQSLVKKEMQHLDIEKFIDFLLHEKT